MSHFAEIDSNNMVINVIVAEQDFINSGVLGDAFNFVQTSYNGNFRKNYANVGYIYDSVRDAFVPPKLYNSWIFNEDICQYEPPTPYPTDGAPYDWNEDTTAWIEVI